MVRGAWPPSPSIACIACYASDAKASYGALVAMLPLRNIDSSKRVIDNLNNLLSLLNNGNISLSTKFIDGLQAPKRVLLREESID
jgi:hypothetical protein